MIRVIRLTHRYVNFVFTTDWHLSDVPPGRRVTGYREQVLRKVLFVRDLCFKYKAAGLFGGDMFHSKSPRATGNTFSLLYRLIEILLGFPEGTLFGVHGNHDVYMDRVDSIPHQPIGAVIASGALTDLSTGSVIFENEDGSIRVQVDAFPYADDMVTLDRVLHAPPREEGVNYRVILMHQYGNPGEQGSLYGHPTIGYEQMAGCDYDLALWGHDHSRAETVRVGNTTHVRLGSLARAALAEDQVDRPVSAALISFQPDKVGFKEIPVPVEPLEIAFVAADKQVEQVRKSDEVVTFFKEMDLAVGDIESTDPREVMLQLANGDKKVYDLAAELCNL